MSPLSSTGSAGTTSPPSRLAAAVRGISPALVAERLGHDIKTLLGTYTHVIRSDEDRVRAVVDDTFGQTAEDWLRTEGVS